MKRTLAVLALLLSLTASAQVSPSRGTSTGKVWDVQNVVWASLVNVTASGNTLTKTGGGADWDTGAISSQSVPFGDVFVEVTASELNRSRIVGLGTGNSSTSYTDVEFGIYLTSAGEWRVYEAGTEKIIVGAYTSGDILRVECVNGIVYYRRNGTLAYTSLSSPSYPLLVDSALFSANATLTNVRIGIPTTTTSTRHP